jgi:hypothetical protein
MNVLEILSSREWVSEGEIRELAEAQVRLVPTLLKKLLSRGLVDCKVDNDGRAYMLTEAGKTQLTTAKTLSTIPPPSWRPGDEP